MKGKGELAKKASEGEGKRDKRESRKEELEEDLK